MTAQQFNQLPLQARFRLFTQWLGNQPESGWYWFSDVRNCALCQFARTLEPDYMHLSAGSTDFTIWVNGQRCLDIDVVPRSQRFGLMPDRFGIAYNSLAKAAGLPRRSHWRKTLCQLASHFVKHKHALAA